LQTTLAMSFTTPPYRLIMNVTDPRQCAITCTRRSPMCRRSSAIAAGWS